jgi:hypothetical protein
MEFALPRDHMKLSFNREKKHVTGRRQFLQRTLLALSSLSVISNLPGILSRAVAEPLPLVTDADPLAKTFNYVSDTNKVDKAKNPQHNAGQKCSGCSLYTEIDKKQGKCQLFAGKAVAAKGWCTSFVAKK